MRHTVDRLRSRHAADRNQSADGSKTLLQVPDECVIGKGAQSEVRLDGWRVGKEHARLFNTPGGVLLEDMGAFGGVLVNGHRIDGHMGRSSPPTSSGSPPTSCASRMSAAPAPAPVQAVATPRPLRSSARRAATAREPTRRTRGISRRRPRRRRPRCSRERAARAATAPPDGFALVLAHDPGRQATRVRVAQAHPREAARNHGPAPPRCVGHERRASCARRPRG